ncbi:hypothetical protein KOR34_26440 [Posidoniimonas corsicana]|uniref:Dockerin domain-containing protein n=1 Tax=Posidoniimonas corsicana TaxID=1938618 RepID=A0A5C5VI42_9BACT|nr:hypothetical protein [Posidoniimonas corsicana]TWT37683.1 hypothetical protein KOR34_26440 [Posidoniimonas corsicana]
MAVGGAARVVVGLCAALTSAALAAAATYPLQDLSISQGNYNGIYFIVRDANAAPPTAREIRQIRENSTATREFYAANSGGTFDLRYEHVLDVPLTLNADGTRIGDWIADAENYVRSQYGIEPEDYHSNVFDVSRTTPDPDQGWSGLAWIPSNNYAVQADINTSWGRIVVDHELGHRIGAPHAAAWRNVDDSNHTPYVYNFERGRYDVYDAGQHGNQPTTLGVHRDEYGNPFDVMGNISHGHFSVHEKLNDLHWLSDTQAPDLDQLGEGVFRIYAHDDRAVTYDSDNDLYGVEAGYAADVLYGLTYRRQAEEYTPHRGRYTTVTQEITIEYRTGRDGVQFYLDGAILDMDPEGDQDRNNQERELEVGRSIRDIDFATSVYQGNEGEDFLSLNPTAPRRPWEVMREWYEFSVLGLGSDAIGSYVDLVVGVSDFVIENAVAGDLNDDGVLTTEDWRIFAAHTHTDVRLLSPTNRYLRGDLDADGDNDYADFVRFKNLYVAANGAAAFAALSAVPEPASAGILVAALAVTALRGGGRAWRK